MRENANETTAEQTTTGEIWKAIDGFKYYEISDLGRARSLPRTICERLLCPKLRLHKVDLLETTAGAERQMCA